ncbi:hypothetical protein BAUCODRAFT_170640 [Baudoinia panamericana UAMH 10762]|uniref:Uncharacterized protein n=1 Tax=Baudoinia panamericana (strain UAMH 10762) TaxID=717646 RepID=M2MUA2_BAUPA|nr:uncharacterized protein BAUCODRAFT_170640 [Baudoinia panamericana UAMH 10762]EMD00492.1 hypothetical protein BAUCODRAFT_170640 [Baudoinia panamericana UAMH 10762]
MSELNEQHASTKSRRGRRKGRTTQIHTSTATQQSRHGKHQHHSIQHPETQGLPHTARPDVQSRASPGPITPTGSPKVAFSAGLPNRLPSNELTGLFNLHNDTGISEGERVIARDIDIQRIQRSMQILGYDLDRGNEAMTEYLVPFWSTKVDPIKRFEALTKLFHEEMDRLLPFMEERADNAAGHILCCAGASKSSHV